jgi:hypothetical protein
MIVLALDPGPHTGIAVVSNNSAVLYAMTFEMGEVTVDELRRLEELFHPTHVVAEAPPQWGGNNRTATQRVEEAIKEAFPTAEWVQPGQWKPTPPGKAHVRIPGASAHVKDAVRIARWRLWDRSKRSANTS